MICSNNGGDMKERRLTAIALALLTITIALGDKLGNFKWIFYIITIILPLYDIVTIAKNKT